MLLNVFTVLCISVVALVAIVGILDTVEKCSWYKWYNLNPNNNDTYRPDFIKEDIDNGN